MDENKEDKKRPQILLVEPEGPNVGQMMDMAAELGIDVRLMSMEDLSAQVGPLPLRIINPRPLSVVPIGPRPSGQEKRRDRRKKERRKKRKR